MVYFGRLLTMGPVALFHQLISRFASPCFCFH
jgi:hypothetical protein